MWTVAKKAAAKVEQMAECLVDWSVACSVAKRVEQMVGKWVGSSAA